MKLMASDVTYINCKCDFTNFIIDISLPITMLADDSASGKSFLFAACQAVFFEIYNMTLITYDGNADKVKRDIENSHNAIVVFDRFDMYPTDTFSDTILANTSNKYLLLGRYPGRLPLKECAYKSLKFTKPNIIHTDNITDGKLQELLQVQDTYLIG